MCGGDPASSASWLLTALLASPAADAPDWLRGLSVGGRHQEKYASLPTTVRRGRAPYLADVGRATSCTSAGTLTKALASPTVRLATKARTATCPRVEAKPFWERQSNNRLQRTPDRNWPIHRGGRSVILTRDTRERGWRSQRRDPQARHCQSASQSQPWTRTRRKNPGNPGVTQLQGE